MKIKTSVPERVFDVVNVTIVILIMLACVYPIWYVLVGSLSSGPRAPRAYLWPINFTLFTYRQIFARRALGMSFFISVSRTVTGTFLCVFFTSMLAYLLTQQKMLLRKVIYRYFLVTMYVSSGLIPWFITMQAYGLQNNFLLYIVPGTISVWNLILVKTFIESLPASMEESAQLDGAGFFTCYIRIILPLIKPIIATITVFTAVSQWNTWYDNYLLVTNANLQTLQLILYNFLNQAQAMATQMKAAGSQGGAIVPTVTAQGVQNCMVIISIIPIMLVYPFAQKYFTTGIMLGAVKG